MNDKTTTTLPPPSTQKMRRSEMEKARLNAAIQRDEVRQDFAHSAENRRRGPERELTHAERDDGGAVQPGRAAVRAIRRRGN